MRHTVTQEPAQRLNKKKSDFLRGISDKLMGFIEANRRGFSRMFDFSGRASRAEYWWFTLTGGSVASILLCIIVISAFGFDRFVEAFLTDTMPLYFFLAFAFIGFFPLLSLAWRRLHDVGLSGGWYLAFILTGLFQNGYLDFFTGIISLYFLGFKRGDTGANKFGENPISFDEHSPSHESISSQLTNTEAAFYEQALAELDNDERDSGVWAKAYAEATDEESSKRLYVKLRAVDLEKQQERESAREIVKEQTPEELRKSALLLQSRQRGNSEEGEEAKSFFRDMGKGVSYIFFGTCFFIIVFWLLGALR